MKRTGLLVSSFLFLMIAKSQVTGSFVVAGSTSTYYPVVFTDGGWFNNIATEFTLGRSNIHQDGTWRGAEIAKFRFHVYAWGNAANFINADLFQAQTSGPIIITNFIGGWQDASMANSTKNMVIWLRGGTTTYYYNSNYAITPVVYDGVANALPYVTPTDNVSFNTKTTPDTYVNQTGMSYAGGIYAASATFNGGVTAAGMTVKNVGDNYIQSTQNSKNYNLIGTYPGWDANSVYIAGYNQYNNSSVSAVTKVFIGGQNGNQFMFDLSTGNEWIGAPNALPNFADNYKLNVNGSIRGNKVVVNTTGADFVFEPNYKLIPISKVEEFIKAHHYLPGIAPAAQMQKEGLDVGDNQTKLLQKIEELTLYIIEQDKKIEAQNKLLLQLKTDVDALKNVDKKTP